MKVAELVDFELDYWVAHAEGHRTHRIVGAGEVIDGSGAASLIWSGATPMIFIDTHEFSAQPRRPWWQPFHVSNYWGAAGPIIERDQIFLSPPRDVHMLNLKADGTPRGIWQSYENWQATVSARTRTIPNPNAPHRPRIVGRGEGPTPLIAAMRAKVASHYGAEVPAL